MIYGLEAILELGWTGLILIWLATIAAALLRSFTGFGFALAAVPAYAFFLTPSQSVVLSASLSLVVGLQTWRVHAGKVPLRPLWPMYLMAVVGTLIGASLLQGFSTQTFHLCIGVTVILASIVLTRYHPQRQDVGIPTRGFAGLCSGLINGAFAIPGPPIVIYVMATEADPARSRALMISFFTFSSLVALTIFAVAGLVSWGSLGLFLCAYPAMYLGDKLGYAMFLRHGGALYRRVAVTALFGVGIAITAKSLIG
jgi:uncharacterized membrane protein YfcA